MGSVREVKAVKTLEALRPADAGVKVRAAPGLTGIVRIGAAGRVSVTFEYEYRFAGKVRYLGCGTWPKSSLATIRDARDEARSLLVRQIDPAAEARNRKLAKRVEQEREAETLLAESARVMQSMLRLTVANVFEQWFRDEVSRHKDGGAYVRRLFERDVLPHIGAVYADALSKRHILQVLGPIKERGADRMCNVALSSIKAMCRFGVALDIISADPSSALTKRKHGTGKETVRDRVLSPEEVAALARQIPMSGLKRRSELALWVMLTTLARVGEISSARKADIDLATGTWRIPAEIAKNGEQRVIYVSPQAADLIVELMALAGNSEWLLPSRNGITHVDPKALGKQFTDRQRESKSKARSRKATALRMPGGLWTAHDLRRTGSTLMGELSISEDVIERCLGHLRDSRLKRTYQHQKMRAQQMNAFNLLGEHIDALRHGKAADDKIVPFRMAG